MQINIKHITIPYENLHADIRQIKRHRLYANVAAQVCSKIGSLKNINHRPGGGDKKVNILATG